MDPGRDPAADVEAAITRVGILLDKGREDAYERACLEGALSNLLAARLMAWELRELERTLSAALAGLAERVVSAIEAHR